MISNSEFDAALKNVDNIRIMKTATKKYRRSLNKDELKNCQYHGLLNALKTYKPKMKFTSWLYCHVNWACYEYCEQIKTNEISLNSPNRLSVETIAPVAHYFDGLPPDMTRILSQKFIDQMSLRDIGKANGYSCYTAKRKLDEALKLVEERC